MSARPIAPTRAARASTVSNPPPLTALALLLTAAVYALLQGPLGITFNATPATIAAGLLVAGALGRRAHFWPSGLVVGGWGVAVLLVHAQVVPAVRTTPAYMIGIGLGLVATALVAPVIERGRWMTTAAIASVSSPLAFYLAYDVSALGRWHLWALALVAWGLVELALWGYRARGEGGTVGS